MNPTKAAVFMTVVALWVSGCSQDEQKVASGQVSEKAKREKAILLEMASRHNACSDWVESLPDRGWGKFFTADLTKALIRTNGRPIAMEACLDDVSERDGEFTGHFSISSFTLFELYRSRHFHDLNLRLVLRCSPQQAETLLKPNPHSPGSFANRFAVVATIESVIGAEFEVITSENGDVYHIDFGSTPDVFYAKGKCVELLYLEWE